MSDKKHHKVAQQVSAKQNVQIDNRFKLLNKQKPRLFVCRRLCFVL